MADVRNDLFFFLRRGKWHTSRYAFCTSLRRRREPQSVWLLTVIFFFITLISYRYNSNFSVLKIAYIQKSTNKNVQFNGIL